MSEETDTQNDQCCKCHERADQTVLNRNLCCIRYTNSTAAYHLTASFRVSQSKAKTPRMWVGKRAESKGNGTAELWQLSRNEKSGTHVERSQGGIGGGS